ncbi:hypothetical protein [Thermostichus vulcanus]|uniref:hypothetical protein n=1 Tax=Thermostichus vulcanus TaxID=32053 RepID=UPI001FCCBC3C|nr:hypothetical protein [Thermostichus vulcanus]
MVSTSILEADHQPRYPLSDHVQVIQPSIPVELLDAESWQGIQAIAQWLPGSLTNFFGFECRLGIPEAAGDFLICLDAQEAGRNTLASAEYGASLLQSEPIWQRIHQLGQHWQAAGSLLSERVHNMWLEFDVERSGSVATPLPSCFIGSLPIYGNPTEGDEIHHWLLTEPLTLLRGEALPTCVQAMVLRCLQSIHRRLHRYHQWLAAIQCFFSLILLQSARVSMSSHCCKFVFFTAGIQGAFPSLRYP